MSDLPTAAEATRRVSRDNCQVSDCMDAMFERVQSMLSVSLREDWIALQREGEFLARHGEYYGLPDVARAARQMCERLDEPKPDIDDIKQTVRKLLTRRPKRSRREP